MLRILPFIFCIALVSGCAISKNVIPVSSSKKIEKIYVLENPKVFMDEFHDMLLGLLEEQGFQTETYKGDLPPEARYHMTYTANWTWDIAMYLVYFRANLYDDGRVAGEVEYDAKMGGANPKKFGTTESLTRPLIQELFANVKYRPNQQSYYRPPANSAGQMAQLSR